MNRGEIMSRGIFFSFGHLFLKRAIRSNQLAVCSLAIVFVAIVGCGGPVASIGGGSSDEASGEVAKNDCGTLSEGEGIMEIVVTSTAFDQCAPIPKKYTGEGQDVSPPIAWSNLPDGTREIVLICDDPDAPGPEPWVHWIIYKIPATVTELPEGIPPKPRLTNPSGVLQGKNSWPTGQTIGYRGPLPPPGGPHRYRFTVYAIGVRLVAQPSMTKKAILEDIRSHILGQGQLIGTYER